MSKSRTLATKIVERTRANITFEDGRTRELVSDWEDSQGGAGYDGGHWGPYPTFRNMVEQKVTMAQKLWSLPAATVRYTRETRTTETIERVTETSRFYSERRVMPDE